VRSLKISQGRVTGLSCSYLHIEPSPLTFLVSYVYAQNWHKLVLAFSNSSEGSSLGDMVHLCSALEMQSALVDTPPGVRRIMFNSHDDILCQLERGHQLTANAIIQSPQHDTNASLKEKDNRNLPSPTEHDLHAVDADSSKRPRSPERSLAVVVIEKSYRRALERRNAFPDRGMSSALRLHFMKCLDHSRTMNWGKESYRFIYLGLLPHLLLCLNWLIVKAQESKQNIKNRRTTGGSHDDMDDLRDSQTKIKYVFSFCNIPGLHF
jgi:hypothetical protein